jgi:ABC-type sugar transport system ATPase subunit
MNVALPILQAQGITKHFAGVTALAGVDIYLNGGEIVAQE